LILKTGNSPKTELIEKRVEKSEIGESVRIKEKVGKRSKSKKERIK
jgi:hypothetical protein